MYVCILNQGGDLMMHHNLKASPDALLMVIAPCREDIVVAVECLFTWYWVADLCAREGSSFVLGHALYVKAIHGGQAKNDKIDAHTIAVLLCGGMLPQAYVYPAAMRATRDLWRRRMSLMRQRAALLTHVQRTTSHYTLPELGKNIASKANRAGVAERFPDPTVQKSIEVDLALLGPYDQRLTELELAIVHMAKEHNGQVFYRLRTIPGLGRILALVLFYAMHDIPRAPRVQEVVSYGRLVKCARESAGKQYGTAGAEMGNVNLKWAFSEAAVLCLRANPTGQKSLARLEKTYGQGKALTVLAHRLARAVYYLGKRDTVFDWEKFLHAYRSGASAPDAYLDAHGNSPHAALWKDSPPRRGTRTSASALLPYALIGRTLRLLDMRRSSRTARVCCPSPEPGTHWWTITVQPPR